MKVSLELVNSMSLSCIVCEYIAGERLFSGLLNISIPNYGMISECAFRQADYGIAVFVGGDAGEGDNQNDGLWCQSVSGDSVNAIWVQPNGDTVPDVVGRDFSYPIYSVQFESQVGLLRPHALTAVEVRDALEGLFQCVITDEDAGDRQTLVLWIIGRDTFPTINGWSCMFVRTVI